MGGFTLYKTEALLSSVFILAPTQLSFADFIHCWVTKMAYKKIYEGPGNSQNFKVLKQREPLKIEFVSLTTVVQHQDATCIRWYSIKSDSFAKLALLSLIK
jgi:hypothetical protein